MSHLDELVRGEIGKIPGVKRESENHTFILCPFHGEKSPSGRILHRPDGQYAGSFKCYGCGRKASWNEIASIFGLKKYGRKQAIADSQEVPSLNTSSLDNALLSKGPKRTETLQLFDLDNQAAVNAAGLKANSWRGFKLPFLQRVGLQLVYVRKLDPDTGEANSFGRYYLYLPILIRRKLRGYIKAQVFKPEVKSIPSYINSSGSWSLKYGLFPYDHVSEMLKENEWSTVVLVEGPRDALRLIRFGIPALCIVGTHSWSKEKLRMLQFLGVSTIVLMMDGDLAGRKATKLIRTGMDSEGKVVTPPLTDSFTVKTVRLWNLTDPVTGDSKYDPGNCPDEILDQVFNLIH